MADLKIDSFKAVFKGGARSYLFEWVPDFPFTTTSGTIVPYLVRSSSVPGDNVEEITANWQGVDMRMAGKRTYEDWTISLNIDYNANIIQDLNTWMNKIHNIAGDGCYADSGYTKTQVLKMLDYCGTNAVLTVELVDAWLKSISEVSLDYSSQDIAQFEITFTYLYHKIS
jgi:hypothetical protein